MNYCSNCGNKLNPADVLCSRCGSLIERVRASGFAPPIHTQICPPVTADVTAAETSASLPESSALPAAAQENDASAAVPEEKLWLEIEEIDSASPSEDLPVVISSEPESDAEEGSTLEELISVPEEKTPNDDGMRRSPDRASQNTNRINASSPPRSPVSKKHAPAIVVLFIWILTAAAVFTGFYFAESYVTENHGGWDSFVRDLTKGKIELDTGSAYMASIDVSVSEAQTEDGAPAHRFDVTMSDGKSIRILPLGEIYNMENGSVSFTVSDEAIAQSLGVVTSDSGMETSGISLDVQTTSQSFTYPITSLTLKLTDAQYKREKPLPETLTTTDTALKISLAISPDATVFINNANHSSAIDDFGHLSVTLPLELGENPFVIETIQPGKRSVKENFAITRELPKIALSLRDAYLRVFETSFECRGTTQSGAAVTALLDGKKFTALVGEDGVFSLACTLANTGVYQMEVTASKEGFTDATAPVMVEYLPAQTTYMEDAKEMTLDKIVSDMSTLKGTDIKTTATIDGNITSENHKQTFAVESEGATMNFYYLGSEKLSAELEYTFYGVVDMESNSFYVMFVE